MHALGKNPPNHHIPVSHSPNKYNSQYSIKINIKNISNQPKHPSQPIQWVNVKSPFHPETPSTNYFRSILAKYIMLGSGIDPLCPNFNVAIVGVVRVRSLILLKGRGLSDGQGLYYDIFVFLCFFLFFLIYKSIHIKFT
jgi:hypothetical protein